MSLKDREAAILNHLAARPHAGVGELCAALFVSEPTMRRDLKTLEVRGKIIRTHGGAMLRSEEPGENIPLYLREQEHNDAKQIIAKKCVPLIRDGDVIMTDASTSVLALLPHLAGKKVMIVTNSAQAGVRLAALGIKTFVTGGELLADSCAFSGSYAQNFLRTFNADICFFSVRTLTPDGRLTDNAIEENDMRRVMLAQSAKKVLLLDAKKIGAPCANTLCTLSDVDAVVSEARIEDRLPACGVRFL